MPQLEGGINPLGLGASLHRLIDAHLRLRSDLFPPSRRKPSVAFADRVGKPRDSVFLFCRRSLTILRIVVLYLKHLAGFLSEKPALFRRMCRRCIDAAAASFRGLSCPSPAAGRTAAGSFFCRAFRALRGPPTAAARRWAAPGERRRSAAEILLLKA